MDLEVSLNEKKDTIRMTPLLEKVFHIFCDVHFRRKFQWNVDAGLLVKFAVAFSEVFIVILDLRWDVSFKSVHPFLFQGKSCPVPFVMQFIT